jgi:outer membrane lipoprotein-sorting protein
MQFTVKKRVCVLLAALSFAGTAAAQLEGNIEYSADQTMEFAEGAIQGKLYHAPGKERRETIQGAMSSVTITRQDRKVMWMLMPEMKTYTEMPLDGSQPGDLSGYQMEFTEVGSETLNGMATTKGKLIMTGPKGETFGGFMWKTPQGIMVKMDALAMKQGSKMRMKQELTNLKIGKQDPQLFEIPPDYQPMSMAGMLGMPSTGKPGDDAAMDDDVSSKDMAVESQAEKSKKPNKPASALDKLKKILRQ